MPDFETILATIDKLINELVVVAEKHQPKSAVPHILAARVAIEVNHPVPVEHFNQAWTAYCQRRKLR